MTESEVGEQGAPLEAARAAVAQVVSALQAGKRPRGRRSLKDAVRLFRGAGRFGEASRALGVLAQLELRHGKEAPALAAARQALRAAQQDPDPRAAGACRELLSETHSRLAQHAQAVKVAEAWLQDALRRDDAPDVVEALLRAALAEWAAGNKSEAFGLVDRALESARAADLEALAARAEALLGRLLLRAGCPAAASDYFTSGIRRTPAADELVPLLQGRGWAWQCLGKPDAAARDFRRALKLARTLTDGRPEVEVLAALAAVESRRARAEDNSARGTRARAMVDRTGRLSRKFRDSHLDRVTPPLLAWAESGDADAGAGVPPTVPEAVQALVQLASGTECLPVVDASVREVERLIQLPEGEPPYHCPLSLLEVAY